MMASQTVGGGGEGGGAACLKILLWSLGVPVTSVSVNGQRERRKNDDSAMTTRSVRGDCYQVCHFLLYLSHLFLSHDKTATDLGQRAEEVGYECQYQYHISDVGWKGIRML